VDKYAAGYGIFALHMVQSSSMFGISNICSAK